MTAEKPVGMGCMRLSDLPVADAQAVLRAGIESGVTLLDTARAYGQRPGDNERLLAETLPPDHGLTVVTKCGMSRPRGQWVPDGRGRSIVADCEASLEALQTGCLDVLLLHAVDPKVAIETSVRALAKLRDQGKAKRIGVCNVSRDQLKRALSVAPIDMVQNALSPVDDSAIYDGVLSLCHERDVVFVAHSPLGGPRRIKKLRKLASLVAPHLTPEQAALAWLRSLGAVPIPGPRTAEAAQSGAMQRHLPDELRSAIPGDSWARQPAERPAPSGREVVLVIGIPGAGKSSLISEFGEYERLNRDTTGGTLKTLLPRLDALLARGCQRVVMDNTYPSFGQRARLREIAWRHGVGVRCVWAQTDIADAQINAVTRLIQRYGGLPTPDRLKALSKTDSHAFLPRAQFDYLRQLEPPDDDEGFTHIEPRPFARRPSGSKAGVVVQLKSLVDRDAGRAFARWEAEGAVAVAYAWDPEHSQSEHEAWAQRLLGGRSVATVRCPHAAGPIRCWCRPPLPGLAVSLILQHDLDPARSTLVGGTAAARTLANRLGMRFTPAEEAFA